MILETPMCLPLNSLFSDLSTSSSTCHVCINPNFSKEGFMISRDSGIVVAWRHQQHHLGLPVSNPWLRRGRQPSDKFPIELCKTSSRRLVVGNIHVLFNPKRGDIKLGQVRMLVSRAHALSEKWGGIPVVLAGDFNSTPQSAIYEFLSKSKLNISGRDRRYLSGQGRLQTPLHDLSRVQTYCWSSEELKNATGDSTCMHLTHPLQMCSAYARVKGNAWTRGPYGEPLATTYHSKFAGTVDYLWYSTGVASTRVLDTLPIGTLKTLGGLPSQYGAPSRPQHPSDSDVEEKNRPTSVLE